MISNILKRLFTGLCLAILLGAITVTTIQAQDDGPVPEQGTTECADCHAPIQEDWQNGSHGQATIDQEFVQMWEERNKPGECLSCHTTGYDAATQTYMAEGITCDACHSLIENGPTHPEQIMTTHYEASACGQCHTDTYTEWQVSQHGEAEMDCIKCHNPHSTSLKTENVQSLCQTCHTTEGHFYNYTAHATEGLLCTDCHLRIENEDDMGEAHSQREHTFAVDLHTCNQCHEQEMHAPSDMPAFLDTSAGSPPGNSNTADIYQSLTTHPPTTSSRYLNFILLAALIGLAFGAVGSPWFERTLRLMVLGVR